MKWLSAALLVLVGFILSADVLHAVGLRRWAHGDLDGGIRLVSLASRLNPKSMNVRLAQVESLFAYYQNDRNHKHLEEASLIAKGVLSDFPGNAEAKVAYAIADSMCVTHPTTSVQAGKESREILQSALKADPISAQVIEQYMFLLTAYRMDYPRFRELGIKRAGLTDKPLRMVCPLCGRGWLEHGRH